MAKRKMNKAEEIKISDLIDLLESEDIETRVTAIEILGEIGDKRALQKLRDKLALVNRELMALITAVGKLKKKHGVK